jgi:hypothetical protein
MSIDDHWIATRIIKARNRHPLVTEAVSARIDLLLTGQLSERQLPSTALTSVARALIVDMIPAPPKPEAKQ